MSQTSNTAVQSNALSESYSSGSICSTTSNQHPSTSDSNLSAERIQRYVEDPFTTTPYESLNIQAIRVVPHHLNHCSCAGQSIPYVSNNIQPATCAPSQLYKSYNNDVSSAQTTHAEGPAYVNEHSNTINIYTCANQAPDSFDQSAYNTGQPAACRCSTHHTTGLTQPHTANCVSQTTQLFHSYIPNPTLHSVQPGLFFYSSESSHTAQPSQPSESSLTTHPYRFPSIPYANNPHNILHTSNHAALSAYAPSIVQAVYDTRTKLRHFDDIFNRSDQQ